MENIVINPENYQADYIKNLNECFGGWGGEKEYDWAFNREVGDKPADIMLIYNEEDEVIAGSAVTYRKLENQKGDELDIAIMTGSWTLPKARGRGCFSKIIDLSKEMAAKRDVPYLTAFVTESNASFRRLANAGSTLVSTSYLFSPEEPYANADTSGIEVVKEGEDVIAAIYQKFKALQEDSPVSYSYSQDEFYQQYINRPKEVELLRIGSEYAIVEETHNAIKVLLLTYEDLRAFEKQVKALTNWALENRSKKLFLFSTKSEVIDTCQRLGFESQKGYYTILTTAASTNTEVDSQLLEININMGDKM